MATTKKPRSAAQLAHDKQLAQLNKDKAVFKSSDEFVGKFEEYLKDQDKTFKTCPPSLSRFADWLGEKRKTVLDYNGRWPNADKIISQMLADIIFEHTVVADYRDAPGIFGLKNKCGWTDKKETITRSKSGDIATPEEARESIQKMFDSIGGTISKGRLSAEAKKSMNEIEDRMIELQEVKAG